MKTRAMTMMLGLALGATGCVHTQTAGETPSEAQRGEEKPEEAKNEPVKAPESAAPKATGPRTEHAAAAVTEGAKPRGPANTTGTSAKPGAERPAAAPGRPQLASSPEGMMLPEGPRLIQQALTRRGYLRDHETGTLDDETSGALRRFQSDEKLARTGAPDRDTLRKLGLAPDKVFRQPGA